MDPEKIATLKRTLVEATDFAKIAECFFDVSDDPDFIRTSDDYRDTDILSAMGQAAARVLGMKAARFEGIPMRLAEYGLVHGAFSLGSWEVTVFYFEDLLLGLMILSGGKRPTHFLRFNVVMLQGKAQLVLN